MDSVLTSSVLSRDLLAADGRCIARSGTLIDLQALHALAARAPERLPCRSLGETPVADAVTAALEAAALAHLLPTAEVRSQVSSALAAVSFPEPIWTELAALRLDDPTRYSHAIWTALVAARLFGTALGPAPTLSRILGGALVHDLGMRLAAPSLRQNQDFLSPSEALTLEDHPLLGALLLASVLGDAPAVHLALLHHLRSGFGYPRVRQIAPLRGLDLLSVASAFAAMIAPRSYRPEPYSARGAIDQLLAEAEAGHFDVRAVRLLIFCMRGTRGTLAQLKLPRAATGQRPAVNCHGIAPAMKVPRS